MKKQFPLSAALLLLGMVACTSEKDKRAPVAADTLKTAAPAEKAAPSLPVEGTRFFAVYTLSSKTTGMVIEINSDGEPGWADSVFSKVAKTEHLNVYPATSCTACSVADSTGPFLLLKNNALEKAIRQQLTGDLYLYGTKGMRKTRYREVLYALDECITNLIVLTIRPEDTTGIGQPLLAASRPLSLSYQSSYAAVDNRIRQQQRAQPGDYTHMDTVATHTFANQDNFYFTYTDNFTIPDLQNEARFRFPSRMIFKSYLPDSLGLYWSNGLDLFGIPCD
ncbi:hypothetical protein [Niabella beijingensis]|uniref:hypothetical protein n=1 Tax=Niabella beijingensis TaxID=2872700 RepID=UPI001CBA72A0|nr:hypothetical protein [Niabella beijingensis]MBZ4190306.1 hypothetical protein [Niabella beijingensis]